MDLTCAIPLCEDPFDSTAVELLRCDFADWDKLSE
jgi:hypothetical protein